MDRMLKLGLPAGSLQEATAELFRKAGVAAGAQASPAGDVRGPIEYKRAMAAEMTVRSLRSAVARALSFA